MAIIAVAGRKGGIGKSTIVGNLAAEFAAMGHSVAVLDADPQHSLVAWAEQGDGMLARCVEKVSGGADALRAQARNAEKDADIVLIDTPPGAPETAYQAALAADLMLLPCGPSPLDLFALKEALSLALQGARGTALEEAAHPLRALEGAGHDQPRARAGVFAEGHGEEGAAGHRAAGGGGGGRGERLDGGRVCAQFGRPRRVPRAGEGGTEGPEEVRASILLVLFCRAVLAQAPDILVVDTHDDTTQYLLSGYDLGARHSTGSIDIPRMRQGGLGAIFFSIWMPGTVTGPRAVKDALVQIDAVREQVRLHAQDLALATTAEEVRSAHAAGKIAVLMGVEGGHMIDSDLAVLRTFYALGVRYMTLTHSVNGEWADSSTDKPAHNGLTDFGKQVVREMNRLGMMVDISHVSDKTFYDVLAIATAPPIASHSSCRALCDSPRNMTDEMIRALAAKGGVIQINYNTGFLSQEYRDAVKAHPEFEKEIGAESEKRCGKDETCQMAEMEKLTRALVSAGKLPRVEWTRIIDHIDHAVRLVGADHVGLGSDFDGAFMPYGMEDASHLPQIANALRERGYSDADIRKILGGNTLRLMERVETLGRSSGSAPDLPVRR